MPDIGEQFRRRLADLQDVFTVRAFRLFSIGNFASLSAIWLVRFCVGWLTWEQTHSKTWLGLMAFAELGPSIIISLYAGTLADRMDRLRILRMGQGLQACLGGLLLALQFSGRLTVWWMLLIMLGFSILGGLNLPARLAAAPSLVGRERIATASAVGSITLNLTRLLGPLIAAPLLVLGYETLAFALATAGFALNAICLSMIRPEESAPASVAGSGEGPAGTFRDVVAAMLADRLLRDVLAIQIATALLVRPLNDMLPAYADLAFGRGEAGFAMLTASVGLGAILGALLVVGEQQGRAMRLNIAVASAVFAISVIVFALSGSLYVAMPVLAVFGAAMTVSGVGGTSFVQARTPIGRLGRVMSVYSLVYRLAPALGALALGALADLVALRPASLAFAVMALLAIAGSARRLLRDPGD